MEIRVLRYFLTVVREGSMYLELGEKVSDAFKPGVELKDSLNI